MAEDNGGTTNANFTVSLSFPSFETITVRYATAAGTAGARSDFVSTAGILTFPPGTTSRTATVRVRGDRQFEASETFFVNLTSPANASVLDGQGVGTILNDDPMRPRPFPSLEGISGAARESISSRRCCSDSHSRR